MGRKTNKNRRSTSAQSAREKAATARAAQQRLDQRRRAVVILSSVVVFALVAGVIAVIALSHKSSPKGEASTPTSASVQTRVTSVPASVRQTIGAGAALSTGEPETIQGTSLQAGGKPTLLFVGGEFCPFCAAERWALVEALSKFGTFSGLQQITSSEDAISTFTFRHMTFTSKYLNFDAKEEADQNRNTLQPLNPTEKAQWFKYLAPGASGPGYPFLDFNGKFVSVDPLLDPTVLLGRSWSQIASALSDPSSSIAKAVDGAANELTAAVCTLTANLPAAACPAGIQGLSHHYQAYKS